MDWSDMDYECEIEFKKGWRRGFVWGGAVATLLCLVIVKVLS